MEAVVIMDIHAHSSIVEAGGLLGGHYDTSSKTLFIKMASPCQSESTKVQCDLCPGTMSLLIFNTVSFKFLAVLNILKLQV